LEFWADVIDRREIEFEIGPVIDACFRCCDKEMPRIGYGVRYPNGLNDELSEPHSSLVVDDRELPYAYMRNKY